MDLGILGHIALDWDFVSGLFSIIIVNLILSGDNAVVIALAVRSLHRAQRLKGIVFGSAIAVVLRIALTFFAAQLLQMYYVQLIGGAFILWIAVELFLQDGGEKELKKEAANFMQAIRIILIADVVMSLDNVLAVAGASKGNLFLLILGLAMSIPIVVGTSTLLSRMMDKYPIIIVVGSAVLGKVGGEMMITDPAVVRWLSPNDSLVYAVEALFAVGVVLVGRLWLRRRIAKAEKELKIHEVM